MSLDSSRWRDLTGSANIRAPLFGFVIKSVLFGMTILQAYQYFMNYVNDSRTRKLTIVAVCSLECIHFAFSSKMMYSSLLPSSKDASTNIVWCMKVLTTVKTMLMLLVQSFYLYLVWILADNMTLKRELVRLLRSISVLTFFFTVGVGVAFLAYLEQTGNIFNFSMAFEHVIYISVGSAAAVDCVISAIMSFVLFNAASRTGGKRSGNVVNDLVLFFVGTGMLNAISKILIIALYASNPSSVLYLAVQFSIPSLYANSILALFNAKSRLKEKMDASVELRVSSALFFGDALEAEDE
ncbi:hypothetical protein GALMADRAFT_143678 [Galerina marginata CBS 339.88]|uniref:DUF6534 domain-containing protein n=1 Tax=Galerina marginata (strain CBS 339.88) TaxID=685588 RepID=A0A067SM01_GALM3|nr:hypothetical protein GALMADRAFT_143678 [Galerina marginata CBS 339.88]